MSEETKANKYQELLDKLSSTDNVKLSEISELDSLSGDVREMLTLFYNAPKIKDRKIGTLLNSIFTQKTSVFIITQKTFSKLLSIDSNIKANNINGIFYNEFIHTILKHKTLERIREPVRGSRGKAGLYRVIEEDILKTLDELIGKEIRQAKEESNIEWYDENILKNKPLSEEERLDIELEEEIRREYVTKN